MALTMWLFAHGLRSAVPCSSTAPQAEQELGQLRVTLVGTERNELLDDGRSELERFRRIGMGCDVGIVE